MRQWKCQVCGYIHIGEKPPEVCPVCGVGPEQFVLVEEPVLSAPAKRWKCDVCDYVHTGDEPPETCPLCGVGKEHFYLLQDEKQEICRTSIESATAATANAALDLLSYGLYVVTSVKDGKKNGQTSNTIFQLTVQPPQIAVCINKNNLTHEYITSSGLLAVSILPKDQIDLVRRFGYQSGRNVDKFAGLAYETGQNGCPVLKESLAYLECEIIREKCVDVGTHTLFVALVTSGRTASGEDPLTYAHYRRVK